MVRKRKSLIIRKWRENLLKVLVYLFLGLCTLACFIPFYLMFSGSFKHTYEIVTMNQTLFPKMLRFSNYVELFETLPFSRHILNTLFVTVTTTAAVLFFCSLAGFAFAKYSFPGRDALFIFILLTMMVPFFALVIPIFHLMKKIGWINTYWALILPRTIPPFGMFLMRQYIRGAIPDDLLNAARVDGCSEFRIYWSVVLPVVIPGLSVLGVIIFMQIWNNFLWPLILISKTDMFTTSLAIASLAQETPYPRYGVTLAACTIATIPVLVMFLIAQKRFISGIMSGFLKG